MSSGCGDVLSLADLQTAKKHQIFEAEVITGKSSGVAGGADIDYATNPVTGQTQKTLPAVLRDAGFSPVSWDFSTGGTLTATDRDKAVYDPVSKTWYSYAGTLPVVVQAAFNPVGNADWKPKTDPDLREELASSGGVSLIGSSVAHVPSFQEAITSSFSGPGVIITKGYLSEADGGSSVYVKTSTTGAPSTGDALSFFDSNGAGWKLSAGSELSCKQFGIFNSSLNQTVKVQSFLDACAELKVSAYIPSDVTAYVVGLVLNSVHDHLNIRMDGEFRLYGDGSAQVNKPSNLVNVGACFGMFINGVTGLTGNMRWHGGRDEKIASEQIHCVGIFGGYGHTVSYSFRECRGDGIYLNHYVGNSTTESPATGLADGFPTAMVFPEIVSINSEIDGRNAISLIAYKGVKIGSLTSKLHGDGGRVIGYQPGGLDVEPNQYWQSCYNLEVSYFDTVAAGSTGGFSLVGKVSPTDPEDTNIRGVWARGKAVTQWYNNAAVHHGMVLASATDVFLDVSSEGYTNPTNANGVTLYGANLSCLKQFNIVIHTKRTSVGVQIGSENLAGATTAICTNGTVDIKASHVHLACRTGMLTGVNVNVTAGTFVNMNTSDMGILEMRQASISSSFFPTTQTSCRYSVNPAGASSFLSILNYGIRNNISNAVIATDCTIDDSDLANVPHNPSSNQNRVIGVAMFRKGRIFGVTIKSGDDAISGTSIWAAGDIIWHTSNVATYAGKRYSGSSWQNFGALV